MTRTLGIFLLFALAAGVALSGCHRRARTTEIGLRTGRVSERRLTNLLEVASQDMGCPAAMLQRQEIAIGVYEVAGCNLVRHYAMPCSNRYHCRWSQIMPIEAAVPAAFQCQPPTVYIQPTQSPLERVVTACDRQAHFVLRCNELDCAWFAIGGMVAAPAQPQGQPTATPPQELPPAYQSAEPPPPPT